jgi:predicted Zn-dependent protease
LLVVLRGDGRPRGDEAPERDPCREELRICNRGREAGGHERIEPRARLRPGVCHRAVQRLGARKIDSTTAPVIFENRLATSLIGPLIGAISGPSVARGVSFLKDHLGKRLFAEGVTITDDPHRVRGLGSTPFDDEGVATAARDVVTAGVVQGYFLGTYSARKLGMESTGNAGGSHNLVLESGPLDFDGLLKKMGRGLVVTELLGSGINSVTGDYSRGAAGFWVEDGAIAYPVHEITIEPWNAGPGNGGTTGDGRATPPSPPSPPSGRRPDDASEGSAGDN